LIFSFLKNISEITKEILMNEVNDEKLKNILSKELRTYYCEVHQRENVYITFTQIAKDIIENIANFVFNFEKLNEIGKESKIRKTNYS
jgi:hypothetical protein